MITHAYPTPAHARAAQEITSFFASRDETDAVLLVCSCARGKATVDSCLDMQVIVRVDAVTQLDQEFRRFETESDAIAELPYYADPLRRERLEAARWFILDNNLARIPWFLDRDLYFQAFDRFQRAFQGFLLGLHVARRTYPIAYNKWIREQIVDNLGLPDVYEQLPRLFELDRFESRALETKAEELRRLTEDYVVVD